MDPPLNIGIAGCGIGGLALATLLARQGHRITLHDRFAAPAPLGSGLVIQPVGLAVLKRVGIYEAAAASGSPIRRLCGRVAEGGRKVLDAGYGDAAALGIHRASLFHLLLDEAKREGAELVCDFEVRNLRAVGSKHLLVDKRGDQSGPYDLIVDAAGANSPLSPLRPQPLRYAALWATVDWPENTPLPCDHLSQQYFRATKMAGVLPVGLSPGKSRPGAAIFWSIRSDAATAWRRRPFEAWVAEAVTFWPEFAPFLHQTRSQADFSLARYAHGSLSQPHSARLIHIGDAAHSASPQLGQGANMALLDALTLAEALRCFDVDSAPARYARMRHHHVAIYQALSRVFTPLYQSDSNIAPALRDHVFAPMIRNRAAQNLLARLISGHLVTPIRGLRLKYPEA